MHFQAKRRALLRTVPAASLMISGVRSAVAAPAPDPWQRATDIIARFATPLVFRDEDFIVTAYGAKPATLVKVQGQVASLVDGTLDTPAPDSPDAYPSIAAAIAPFLVAGVS